MKINKTSIVGFCAFALSSALISFSFIQESKDSGSKLVVQKNAERNVFSIKNSKNVSLPIGEIGKLHPFEPNEVGGSFRCVSTQSLAATDFGPYNDLYFLFDNEYEMPHRSAVFKIGSLASISSFKKIADSKYQVIGMMFSNANFQTFDEVVITIDATNLLNLEAKYKKEDSEIEGEIDSEVIVSVNKLR